MDQAQLHYLISYDCRGKEICIKTDSSTITFPDLQPATEYSVTVSTVLENGNKSQPVSTTFTTSKKVPLKPQYLHFSSSFYENVGKTHLQRDLIRNFNYLCTLQ